MKPVREIISRELIDDLWGCGYTILPRNRHPDPFFVDQSIVPQGRSYQWMHLVHDKVWYSVGWSPVPASRHDGYFMPAGFVGDIEVSGLGLFEKPKFEVDAERINQVAAAQQQVDDWKAKWAGTFSGEASVGGEKVVVGGAKTIEDVTKVPKDMVPYIGQIFQERDRLSGIAENAMHDNVRPPEVGGILDEFKARVDLVPDTPRWPTLNAIILPTAIENVRKQITQEACDVQAPEY